MELQQRSHKSRTHFKFIKLLEYYNKTLETDLIAFVEREGWRMLRGFGQPTLEGSPPLFWKSRQRKCRERKSWGILRCPRGQKKGLLCPLGMNWIDGSVWSMLGLKKFAAVASGDWYWRLITLRSLVNYVFTRKEFSFFINYVNNLHI